MPFAGIVQAPVRYRCRSTPTRAGVYKPPYTIISPLDSTVPGVRTPTVWIADNAGLQVGLGTPLYPGTSLTWTQEGELWVVSDTPTDIIVSYDVEDWQPDPASIAVATATALITSGIVLVDNPVVLFSANLTAANGRTTGWIDISRYQSLSIQLAEIAASAGTFDSCQIEFSNDNGVTISMVRTIETFDVNPNIGSTWRANIPASGTFVRISSSLTSTNYALKLTGSNRPRSNIEQSVIDYNANITPDFYYALINPFPIGMAQSIMFGPWYGEIELVGSCVLGGAFVAGSINNFVSKRNDVTGAFNATYRMSTTSIPSYVATLVGWSQRIVSSGNVFRYEFINNTAFNLTNWTARISPVSGYGAVT